MARRAAMAAGAAVAWDGGGRMGTDGPQGRRPREDNFSRFLRVSGTGREDSWFLRYLRRLAKVPRGHPVARETPLAPSGPAAAATRVP